MKIPSEFKTKDWVSYLKLAVQRETGKQWKPKAHMIAAWTRVFKNLTQSKEYDGIDPFLLALAIDVIALEWLGGDVISPWEVLAPGKLFYQFVGKSKAFWRAVWFSRYAITDREVNYYDYHLTQYEAGLAMEPGEFGRYEMLKNSKRALAESETFIMARIQSNMRPLFRMHWLEVRFGLETY